MTICGFLILLLSCTTGEIIEGNKDNDVNPPALTLDMQVVEIVNREREKQKLAPLEIDESLMKSCDTRAKEIATKYSHTRPDETSCFTVIETPYRAAGENIAYGQKDAKTVMDGWMNSKGHRENILSADYTHIGVGCYERNKQLYWVQLFIQKK